MTIVQEKVRSFIPFKAKSSPGGWISHNCPMCMSLGHRRADTKGRGGWRFNQDGAIGYNCFNCGFKTVYKSGKLNPKLVKLLKALGAQKQEIDEIQLIAIRTSDLVKTAWQEKITTVDEWKEVILPGSAKKIDDCEATENFVEAVKYIADRKLLDLADWHFSDHKIYDMQHRIILPYKYGNKIVGYTARHIKSLNKGRVSSRYITQQPRDYVYNLDAQKDSRKYVIVTEGPFDALSVDGVSVGSNRISRGQVNIINSFGKAVIVLPDFDHAGKDFARQAIKHKWSVSFPQWKKKYKDPNQAMVKLSRLDILKSVLDGRVTNPTKIKVLLSQWK